MIASVLLVILTLLSAAVADNAVYLKAPSKRDDPEITYKNLVLHTDRQANIKALLTTVKYPVGYAHVFPSHADGCTGREKLEVIAEENNCQLAINGGPFNMKTGACVGNIISNATIFQLEEEGEGYASWGLTADGVHIFGDVSETTVKDADIVELVSGFISPLLVSEGKPAQNDDTLVAQRQALGVDSSGALLFLTIDGAENRDRGMLMSELAQAMADIGAQYAVNLDGGGSTATWMKNKGYINRPTCQDSVVPVCDRAVANIICVTA
jgi:exopolysaccharide biosynthesis protein